MDARFLCALGLSALAVVTATTQTTVPATLSATLRDHLKDERFDVVTSLRGFPLGVRDTLQTMFGGETLDVAESKTGAQGADASANARRPLRRLVAAGCSIDHCLVYYERGGSDRTWLVALLHWTPAETRVEWGGYARGGLATVDDVRKAVLAGTIKGPVKAW
jgi:hypothetical protein